MFLNEDGANDPGTPLETIVRHIDYVATRIGIDHVAFGSDFDGAEIPEALGGIAESRRGSSRHFAVRATTTLRSQRSRTKTGFGCSVRRGGRGRATSGSRVSTPARP